jgi:tetratricopeptide (TPR) repeat protein
MTTYVWSATNQAGETVVREIAAATAEDAKFVLLAQGYTHLELKQDEVGSAALAGFPKRHNRLGAEIKENAAERLKHRDNPTTTFLAAWRTGIVQNGLIFLGLVFFTLYSGWRHHWGYAGLYAGGILALLGYILFMNLQSVYYQKLICAADWNRWGKVLTLVARLQWVGRLRTVKLSVMELTRYRAGALAGLGRLEEGLALLKTCEGQPDCPGWLHALLVAGLYDIARQPDKAIECNLASLALQPTSVAWLDLANRFVRYPGDAVKARIALDEAEKSPLSDLSQPFALRCEGVIAYLEGDYVLAQRQLETGIAMVEAAKGRPYRDGYLAIARGYLCCALAKRGDLAGANQCFARAEKYLLATGEVELLAECRRLTGK